MSEALGPVTYGARRPAVPRRPLAVGANKRNFSEETARAIDHEVRAIVERGRAGARRILERAQGRLEAIAQRLLEVETLDRAELEGIVAGNPASKNQKRESQEVAS